MKEKRFTKVKSQEKGLIRENQTGMFYVRLFRKGKGELFRSLGETNQYLAEQRLKEIVESWEAKKPKEAIYDDVSDMALELKASKSDATYESFESHDRLYLRPYFSGMEIEKIEGEWDFYVAGEKKKSKRKVKHDREAMLFVLNTARKRGFLKYVPELKIPEEDKQAQIGREYTDDELERIYEETEIRDRDPRANGLRLRLELEVRLGMRQVDVKRLKHEYIGNGRIHIPAEACKRRIPRVVALPPDLEEKLKERCANGSEFVFPNARDATRPMYEKDATWRRIKQKLGIRGKRHWMRHTAATRMLRADVPKSVVEKGLGMSRRVLDQIYYHVNEDDLKKMSEAVVIGNQSKVR